MNDSQNYRVKKYRDDTVFQLINRKYLTLQEEERKKNNDHLKTVIEQIFIPLMKKDELFAVMYKRIMYGGSYYKGTKYGKPEEFDLDFVVKLPIKYTKIIIDANHDNFGFVKIKLDTQGPMHPDWEKHSKILSKWLTYDHYLDQNKFRAWIEKVFTSAFSEFNKNGRAFVMEHEGRCYYVTHRKSGPAFTLIIKTPTGSIIDVDLVPCLEFDDVPLGNGYKPFTGYRKSWMVVAKPLSAATPNQNILWRLCFYEQEREFLRGDVKPVIRMMKKFRDTMQWKSIASYFIETLFYHELENNNDLNNFLRAPKTWMFMHILRRMNEAFEKHNLPYFWHPNHNLLGKINPYEIKGYHGRLNRLIAMIDSKIEDDRFILADVVLETHEAEELRMDALQFSMSNMTIPPTAPTPPQTQPQTSYCAIM